MTTGLMFPKPDPSLLRRRAEEAEKKKAWTAAKSRVRRRDSGRCRLCGRPMHPDVHHILERSLGGRDEDRNLVALCRQHHEEAQAHLIRVSGDPLTIGGLTFTIDPRVSGTGREETVTR